jgi:hypothetical protein
MTRYKSDGIPQILLARSGLALVLHVSAVASFHLNVPLDFEMMGRIGSQATIHRAVLGIRHTVGQHRKILPRPSSYDHCRSLSFYPLYHDDVFHNSHRSTSESERPPLIVFPGGGIYFWWQVYPSASSDRLLFLDSSMLKWIFLAGRGCESPFRDVHARRSGYDRRIRGRTLRRPRGL